MCMLGHPELSSQMPAFLLAGGKGVTQHWPLCQHEVKKKCSTCLLYSWREAAQATTSHWVKNKPSVKGHHSRSAPAIHLRLVEAL